MWYCAHAIFYFKLKYKEQDSFFIHENVYIIDANNEDEAMDKALECAESYEDQNDNDTLKLNGESTCCLLAGIRKLRKMLLPDSDNILRSGYEVTFSALEVDTLEEVDKLANGEFVDVLHRY